MNNRLVVMFYESGDYEVLCRTLTSFVEKNNAELYRFRLVIHLKNPDKQAVNSLRDFYSQHTISVTTGPKVICVPCILKRYKVRYGVVIPPGYISAMPLWPYIDELKHTLSVTDNLSHIKLVSDTDSRNTLTLEPLAYTYCTSHVLVGNGNLRPSIPALVKSYPNHTKTSVVGRLKPLVFTKEEV